MGIDSLVPFREGLFELDADGRGFLLANRCQRCGFTFSPKRPFSIRCAGSDRMKEVRPSDCGTLHTYTVVHRASPELDTLATQSATVRPRRSWSARKSSKRWVEGLWRRLPLP